ncbi:MAG TPA: hypothetical protein DD381_10355 [Lentisphaeria bacterium]|nr:MAG: hypothetical protein A2X47_13860 [Lentisphaerae bacterium GWF2_38_69]HBM16727.1 hypothetical protein [Lentisphaeria bacterium]
MKQHLIIVTILLSLSTTLMADFVDTSYKDTIISVRQAIQCPDDTWVILKGQIVKRIDDDEFIFQDSTGEITIEVSRFAWKNQDVTTDMTVIISGKIDQDGTTVVNVDKIEIVSPPAATKAPTASPH